MLAPALALLLSACSLIDSSRRAKPIMDGPPTRKMDPATIVDAVPRAEPKSRYGNPAHYEVMGKRYHVLPSAEGYREEGIASWYGTKFHGRRTSSGEPYDLYAMTAAHKSLPLPCYVTVENLQNGRSTIVRVNDRGPFHPNRIIDLSYAAAVKLGIDKTGTGLVRVTTIDPGAGTARSTRAGQDTEPAQSARAGRSAAPVRSVAPVQSTEPGQSTRETRSTTPVQSTTPVRSVAPVRSARAQETPGQGARPGATGRFFIQFGAFAERANAEALKQRLSSLNVRIHSNRVRGKAFHQVRLGPLQSVDEADRLVDKASQLGVTGHRIIALP